MSGFVTFSNVEKLKMFVITVDGKPFIKCDDPNVRVDFKWNKLKPRRFKMCIAQKDADELVDDICGAIGEDGFDELTPQQKRDIIRGICDNKMC